MKKTPLKRSKTRLHWISPARIRQLNSEVQARKDLCYRCGGQPVLHTRPIEIKGTRYELTTVICIGGHCEICGKSGLQLCPHEWPPRSLGGKVSLKDSKMVCYRCHVKEQKSSPIWSKPCQ